MLAGALHAKPADRDWEHLKAIKRDLKMDIAAHPEHDLMISAEYLSTSFEGNEANAVAARLTRMGYAPKSCIFVRNTIDLMNSAYAQRCKMLHEKDFNDFYTMFQDLKRGNLMRRLRLLEAANLNPSVLLFAKKYSKDSLAQRLFGAFEISDRFDASFDYTVPRSNESFGELGVAVSYIVKAAIADAGLTLTQPGRQFLVPFVREATGPYDTKKFSAFSPEQSAALLAKMRPQIEKFADKYLPNDFDALIQCDTAALERSPWSLGELEGQLKEQAEDIASSAFKKICASERYPRLFPSDPFSSL